MTAIERRLAAGLHEAASEVDAACVPPLVLPEAPPRPGRGRPGQQASDGWRQRAPRMLAPAAAAAAVLAIAAGVAAIGP
ncbi:MAG TPA: hypothetical protein VF843_17860, partial [Streptosporangiaceae bacterium]